ncbi:MAG TPA: hypothetical protein VII99_05570, partial [Bacteroidia bacterium]
NAGSSRKYFRSHVRLTKVMPVFWNASAAGVRRVAVIVGIALCAFIVWTKPSNAIENLKIVRGVLILEGKIERGDYIKVRDFLGDATNFNKMTGEVFVASQGGNVFEALEIGYLIRRLRLGTDAPSQPPPTERSSGNEIIHPNELTNPKNYQCTSACFLLFVAGIYREFVWAGRLGLHHPRLEYKPIGATENALSAADEEIRNKVKSYLEEMNVPDKYLTLMYSTAPDQVRLITQAEFNADLKGYVWELRDLLQTKCLGPNDRDCVRQTRAQLRAEAWQKIFHPG